MHEALESLKRYFDVVVCIAIAANDFAIAAHTEGPARAKWIILAALMIGVAGMRLRRHREGI